MLQLEILPFDVHTWKKGFKHINEKAASVEGDFFSAFIYIWSVP
jgi:hypothetical protein